MRSQFFASTLKPLSIGTSVADRLPGRRFSEADAEFRLKQLHPNEKIARERIKFALIQEAKKAALRNKFQLLATLINYMPNIGCFLSVYLFFSALVKMHKKPLWHTFSLFAASYVVYSYVKARELDSEAREMHTPDKNQGATHKPIKFRRRPS